MSDAPAEFSFDDLPPHIPKTAAQVGDSVARELADSVERGREKVAKLAVAPELTARQKLGNKIFFLTLTSVVSWMSLFLTWERLSLRFDSGQVDQIRSGSDIALRIFGQTLPAWTIATMVTFGVVMCLLNLLKLTGVGRRYIFATFGCAALLSVYCMTNLSYGHSAGIGLLLTVAITIGVCVYSWSIRTTLR